MNHPWKMEEKDSMECEYGWIYYTGALKDYHRKLFHSAYYFDQYDVTKWFPSRLRWNFCPGDVYFTPKNPTVLKSRLLSADNVNSVVLKLDKLRHFMFVHMTRPTCETWFMEGTLIPDYHYVEVKEDFSDFEEKLNFYMAHPEKAEEVIRHAHDYVKQFLDKEREELIQLMVMKRYFETSGQL